MASPGSTPRWRSFHFCNRALVMVRRVDGEVITVGGMGARGPGASSVFRSTGRSWPRARVWADAMVPASRAAPGCAPTSLWPRDSTSRNSARDESPWAAHAVQREEFPAAGVALAVFEGRLPVLFLEDAL